MKAHILDLGWLEGDANWMVGLSTYATKSHHNVSSKWASYPVYAVLFETEQGYILYDTGMDPKDYDRSERFPYYYGPGQTLPQQLSRLGLATEDISLIVLSHMHDDHCGGLPLFPGINVCAAKEEYDYVKAVREKRLFPAGAYKRIRLDSNPFRLISGEYRLTKALRLIPLPGHSAGLLGILASFPRDGNKLFVMDAINTAQNYGPPEIAAVGLYNNALYFQSLSKIRLLERKWNAEVIFGHDLAQFHRLKDTAWE